MPRHGLHGSAVIFFRLAGAQLISLADVHPSRHVHEYIVGWGLVGDDIRDDPTQGQLGIYLCSITDQPDGFGQFFLLVFFNQSHGFLKGIHHHIHITHLKSSLRTRWIHLDNETNAFIHGDSQGLGATHSTQASSEHKFAF